MAQGQVHIPLSATCVDHPMMVFQYFCEDDKKLACRKCVTDTHKGHMLTDIDQHADKIRQEINDHMGVMSARVKKLKDEEKEMITNLANLDERKISMLKVVSNKVDSLKKQLDLAKAKLEGDIDKDFLGDFTSIQSCLAMIDSNLNKIQTHIAVLQDVVAKKDLDMLEWISQKNFDVHSFDVGEVETPLYSPMEHFFASREVDDKRLGYTIGRLQKPYYNLDKHKCQSDEFPLDTLRRGEIHTDEIVNLGNMIPNVANVHAGVLFPVHNALAWVGFQRPGILKLLSVSGREKMSISTDFVMKDMVISKHGEVLVSEDKGSKVWRFTFLGRKREFYDAKPFTTRCMAVTKKGEILLCVQKPSSKGKIIKLDPNGTVMSEYTKDKQGTLMLQQPDRVHERVNGDILVLDWEPRSIYCFDADFEVVKFIYNGNSSVEQHPFKPYGVTSDQLGHVYISDYDNNYIHILQPDGQYLTILKFSAPLPRRVAIDTKNKLWVTCDKATVYTVNLRNIVKEL